MFSQLSYQQKNMVLAIGFVLFALLVYFISVAETVELIQKNNAYVIKLENYRNAPEKINLKEAELKFIDESLGSTAHYEDFQQLLLEEVTLYCEENKLQLSSFPRPYSGVNENYLLQTFHFEVEGSFHAALQLIYLLEEEWKIGRAVSATFQIKENYRTKEKKLYTTLFMQSIKAT